MYTGGAAFLTNPFWISSCGSADEGADDEGKGCDNDCDLNVGGGLAIDVFSRVTSGKEGIAKGLYAEGVIDAIIEAWCSDREVEAAAAEGIVPTDDLPVAEGTD